MGYCFICREFLKRMNAMNKKIRSKPAALFLSVLFLLTAMGCAGRPANDGDDSLNKIIESGELILGLDAGFPPMGYEDENGDLVGFDIDVAQEVCDRLGVELVKVGIDWDEKENDLNEGRIDCIWNGFSVTPAREEALCLSAPYMKNELIVVVPAGSDILVVKDLPGKTVGVQSGSTAQEVLEASNYYPDITEKLYDTTVILIDKLEEGEVDAALLDSISAYHLIFSKGKNRYYTLSDSFGEEEFAIGFRKGDVKLRDRIWEIISEMKADGTLGKISKKWFGSDITIVK